LAILPVPDRRAQGVDLLRPRNHESIDTNAPRQLLNVRVAFKQPRPDGMPANEEFQNLRALEDGLEALVQQQKSVYVGRVTVNGHRDFYIYTAESEAECPTPRAWRKPPLLPCLRNEIGR
jgi:hypothetical protein